MEKKLKPNIRITDKYLLDHYWEEITFSQAGYPPPKESYGKGFHQCKDGDKGWLLRGENTLHRMISDHYMKLYVRYEHVLESMIVKVTEKAMKQAVKKQLNTD